MHSKGRGYDFDVCARLENSTPTPSSIFPNFFPKISKYIDPTLVFILLNTFIATGVWIFRQKSKKFLDFQTAVTLPFFVLQQFYAQFWISREALNLIARPYKKIIKTKIFYPSKASRCSILG